jgi:hypothetical protein
MKVKYDKKWCKVEGIYFFTGDSLTVLTKEKVDNIDDVDINNARLNKRVEFVDVGPSRLEDSVSVLLLSTWHPKEYLKLVLR